jgi:uncharacterized protein (DUF1330 family)
VDWRGIAHRHRPLCPVAHPELTGGFSVRTDHLPIDECGCVVVVPRRNSLLPSPERRGCGEANMPAYLIVEHKITDPAKFQEYGDKVRPLVAKYGGRSLARGSHRVLETKHWLPDRVIIFEFPDMETLNTWYNAPEYQPLKALRQSAVDMSKDMMIAVESA